MPELVGLHVADPAERWAALGFVVAGGQIELDGVRVELGTPGVGITAWSLTETDEIVDGLPTARPAPAPVCAAPHPNGALAVDHVVVITPDFQRTSEALAGAGMPLKRTTEMRGTRMGFCRIGPAILELVEDPNADRAHFWGLVVVVEDLEALARRLGERLGEIKPAVQPGRRIATLKPSAELGTNVAFMEAERRSNER